MPTNKPIISSGERPHHSVYNPRFRGAGAACRPLRRATKGSAFGNRKPLKRLDLNLINAVGEVLAFQCAFGLTVRTVCK